MHNIPNFVLNICHLNELKVSWDDNVNLLGRVVRKVTTIAYDTKYNIQCS